MTRKTPGGKTSGMRSRSTAARPAARPDRQGALSQQLKEARRKKRQKQVMRNRLIFVGVCAAALLIVILLIVKLFGFISGVGKKAETSTITFDKDGKVVFEEVVDFDTETYSKSDLKDYTNDLITKYNDSHEDDDIELDKVSVSDNKAYIKTTYKNAETYSGFTSYQTFDGTYESAIEAGYDFNTRYSTVTEATEDKAPTLSESQSVDTDTAFAGKRVVAVNENVTVVVPGIIEYVSDADVEVISNNTIKISPADGNNDSTSLVYIVYRAE
ncbi:MAG: hypothetical protein J6Y86_09330 [Pseudobutyrivibrio sp.]|nr:hypothetical protein [Pseudobutyrivibrio sp.]